jgi:NDP-sugar pyrophosphorylase family protein
MFTDCDAAILSGGLGTRLRPVVLDRPKVLAPLRKRPFIAHLLDQLADAGLPSVVLCTGHRGEQVRATLGDRHGPLKLAYSQEPAPLGTAGALRHALGRFCCGTVLVLNGDSYCDADLHNFLATHRERKARASIVLRHVEDAARYGSVQFNADGAITRFEEKNSSYGAGWINAGIYLLDRRLIEGIPEDRAVSIEREMFPAWVGEGFFGHLTEGRFLDIGTPESYAAAESLISLP